MAEQQDVQQQDMQQQQGGTPSAGGTPAPENFESWLEQQPEQVRGLIDGHVAGLKSALDSERKQRKDLAKALKDATSELEQGTKARDALEAVQSQLGTFEAQILAYEALQQAGATNLKLAWLAARDAAAIGKDGQVDLELLKRDYPELFRKSAAVVPGNAGSGAGGGAPTTQRSMDAFIRQAAGRK